LLTLLVLLLIAPGCAEESPVATAPSPSTTTTLEPTSTTTAAEPVPGTSTTIGASTTTSTPPFPVTIGDVVIATPPRRIAALSSTHVEILFALGAGDRVIAGDLFSNHPAEAAGLDQIDAFNLNVEAVASLDPDLVILGFDPGDAVASFAAIGIPALLMGPAADLDEMFMQYTVLGTAIGDGEAADRLIEATQAGIDAAVTAAGDAGQGISYYHETDPFSFYTPNSSTFIGRVYALFGMENIADAASDEFGTGYPQLSPEFVIASDPDWVFLTYGEDAASLAARPGWDTLSALEAGHVITLDSDITSRWGPRVADFAAAVSAALREG
jgi:iron complex transport system substrate-binding protein